MSSPARQSVTGWIWDIKRYALHDGPGIRSTVFFNGCPLRCLWCCNPESQSATPRIVWLGEQCLDCDSCRQLCEAGAVQVEAEGRRWIDPARCDLCGRCVERCPGGALQQLGRSMTVEQVLEEVMRDAVFFQRSGGGMTLSGGEPAAQARFARELLRRYKLEEYGPHAALETCGQAPWSDLAPLLEYSDLVLFDLKQMDSEQHRRFTGVGNELILANAVRVAESGVDLVIRLPLIPGYTDSEENVGRTADFARSRLGVSELHLLPYHRLGEPKYERLGRPYPLQGERSPSKETVSRLAALVEAAGLRVVVGG